MKKILIVMSSLYNGGAERSLVNLLNEFPKDKYEVDILLFKRGGLFMNQVPKDYQIIETPSEVAKLYGPMKKSGMLFPIRLIANAASLIFTKNDRERRAYRWKYFYEKCIHEVEKEYDVALAYISGEILYFLDEKVHAKKKIVWIHNDYRTANHPRKYDYKHLQNMDAIVSISDSCVDILKEEFPEFSDKIFMIENITSSVVIKNRADEFYPEEYDRNTSNILSIGRLSEQKGFDMAVEAASILKNKGINFKWFIIGSGELEDKLNAQIKSLDLEDNFVLLGARENPYPYIKNSTIFAQTSRYEGKSVVMDEAKILGATILATNYPTVNDQLVNGTEGHIVEMNSKGIAEGVEFLLGDEVYRNKLSNYLRSREYGNQDEINKYIEVIG